MRYTRLLTAAVAVSAVLTIAAQTPQQPPSEPPPPSQQPSEIRVIISGPPGLPPKIAVPDFLALSGDAETVAAAKTIGQVLFDDLNFEREFYLIGRDTYRTVPQPASLDQVPLLAWKELGADGVLVGSVRKTASGAIVQARLIHVTSGKSAFAKEYSGSIANPRLYAHTIADEVHLDQRGLNGIARTKLAFSSDRDGLRMKGPLADRDISEIYFADYDGAHARRVTATRSLSIAPAWAPDGRSIAYTSYRRGYPDIIVQWIYEIRSATPARGTQEIANYLPAWSPDGTRMAFMSNRDGNPEIYVMNRDGSGLRRLTNHPENDATPTWAPSGAQIAFTSNRSGSPQIWVVNADGGGLRRITSESHCDRATWSPLPYNEIAYASRAGGGNNIRIYEFGSGQTRNVTDGIGNNESPTFAPNGRHLAFVSTRSGREQIFTIARDGNGLRQITREGTNRYPNWSR
jgi:TolB protein